MRKTLSFVGGCLPLGTFTDANLVPATDVKYVSSVHDGMETTLKSGEELARLLPLRRPNIWLNHRAQYEVTAFTGDAALPLYFLGKPDGDKFLFKRFSRDVQSLRRAEIAAQQAPLNKTEAVLWLSAICCGAAAALIATSA
jgi:hypothetical protein